MIQVTKKWVISMVFACLALSTVLAQDSVGDGAWLKIRLDSYYRTVDLKKPKEGDFQHVMEGLIFVGAVLEEHRTNNMKAAMVFLDAETANSKTSQAVKDSNRKLALAFAPLFPALPQKVTAGQIIHILRNYLDKHPEKWQDSANSIFVDALKEAFASAPNK